MDARDCPLPEGEYHAVITQASTVRREGTDYLDVTWRITTTPPALEPGDPHRLVPQYIPLQRTPEGHIELAFGLNLHLDMLRRAVSQAMPMAVQDRPWHPSQLRGRGARVLVRHLRDRQTGNIRCVVHSVIEPGVTQVH